MWRVELERVRGAAEVLAVLDLAADIVPAAAAAADFAALATAALPCTDLVLYYDLGLAAPAVHPALALVAVDLLDLVAPDAVAARLR